ncbi:DEAD/DEAH box helicase family protein [Bifidobacterium olomucense]|nr:DEAD/DEAH box helicase family protein [Bifidobacterium sp. DSM 109959]
MGNFDFVKNVFPFIADDCARAESYISSDPIAACVYARRAIDGLVEYLHYDVLGLKEPYRDDLSGRIHNPGFMQQVSPDIINKLDVVRKIGNKAAHDDHPSISEQTALATVRELFHIIIWTGYHLTAAYNKVPVSAQFDPALAKQSMALNPTQSKTLLIRTLQERKAHAKAIAERDALIASQSAEGLKLKAELEALRAQIEAAQQANTDPDTHDYHYNEADTRTLLIDMMLEEQGWTLNDPRDREYKVDGMPPTAGNPSGIGYADYVLWGDDGKPLAVVEAKRASVSPLAGQQQARQYADCLERRFGQRPVIFTTNGYATQIWDDAAGYPPRDVQGFYKKAELQRLVERRASRRMLSNLPFDAKMDHIAGRAYQKAAIRAVDEAFDAYQRDALLVMATGTGKTRVVISLVHQLMEAGWVKNVLFLADRTALVNQAANAFKNPQTGLGDSVPVVNLLSDAERNASGRIYLSTYPTMMNLVNARERDDATTLRFGPGFFDLVIIDEAHRSVYAKYGFLFDYFDSLLVGLTATPRNEIDRNTYRLFHLEYDEQTGGVPTFAYDLDQAVHDGYLVPARSLSVNTKFMDRGISYDELSPEEQEQWDSRDWDEDGEIPDSVSAGDVNRILFNADTIDKVLSVLMQRGLRVGDGDVLGKTIVFARNQRHAEAIKARFDLNWPGYHGTFAQIVTHATRNAQQIIDDFSAPEQDPRIAISVDMLDTGIDVPDVVNLVFFKPVMSRTKYWQMIGRGTRLRPDLYGPGRDKTDFLVIDCCDNLAYFNQNLPESNGYAGVPLSDRIFRARLALLETLDATAGTGADAGDPRSFGGSHDDRTRYRAALARTLGSLINGMDPDGNVIVRPHRHLIETARRDEWWKCVTRDKAMQVSELAGLPSAFRDDGDNDVTNDPHANDNAAKRFDLMIYSYELAVLRADAERLGREPDQGYGITVQTVLQTTAIKRGVQEVADALRGPRYRAIPSVAACADLLEAVSGDDWWADVTVPMLETARKRLRGIMRYAASGRRKAVFTDFEDELTVEDGEKPVSGGDMAAVDMRRLREKATAFLRGLDNNIVLARVRTGRQITEQDLAELERMLIDNGVGDEESIDAAAEQSGGLGLFIRSLVGLEPAAVQAAFSRFLDGSRYNARQIEFVNMIVRELTANGVMSAARLYEPPFSDISGSGPEELFGDERDVDDICDILDWVQRSAMPATRRAVA